MSALPAGRFPWQAAFVAYCNNAPEDEISQVFGIPLDALIGRMQKENWPKLRAKLPLAQMGGGAPELPAKVNAQLALIKENREQNLAIWAKLREDVLDVVSKLRSGELKIERQWHNKGAVTRADVDPTLVDKLNLATYFRTVADGTYRALGDVVAQEKSGPDASAGAAGAGHPAITIILPGAIAQPRQERELKSAAAEVIDLRPLTEEQKP